ncbi:MAG TPA: hypothetical protein VFT84_00155, partial [Gemmatimonadales bacterium]|nr:hypothetical protein [Gemmatimonadales bacterium]
GRNGRCWTGAYASPALNPNAFSRACRGLPGMREVTRQRGDTLGVLVVHPNSLGRQAGAFRREARRHSC